MTEHDAFVVFVSSWLVVTASVGCRPAPPADRVRVSGQVEATEVQVSSPVAGRLISRKVNEGARVEKDAVVAVLDTADAELAVSRAKAERAADHGGERRKRHHARLHCRSANRRWQPN